MFSFSSLQSASGRKSQITKRVNHISNQPSSNNSPQKSDTSTQPPPVAEGLPHGTCLGAPPKTSFKVKTTLDKSEEELVEGGGEEEKEKTFDQVLTSLTKLTEEHCETLQVNLCS